MQLKSLVLCFRVSELHRFKEEKKGKLGFGLGLRHNNVVLLLLGSICHCLVDMISNIDILILGSRVVQIKADDRIHILSFEI